jgi:hypothetical protein
VVHLGFFSSSSSSSFFFGISALHGIHGFCEVFASDFGRQVLASFSSSFSFLFSVFVIINFAIVTWGQSEIQVMRENNLKTEMSITCHEFKNNFSTTKIYCFFSYGTLKIQLFRLNRCIQQ